jgi:hypothetical protein
MAAKLAGNREGNSEFRSAQLTLWFPGSLSSKLPTFSRVFLGWSKKNSSEIRVHYQKSREEKWK